MNTNRRRAVLVATIAMGLFVGGWAAAMPRAFYDSFPGFGFTWVASDGPYNEHLVRDVGSMYLALVGISVAALVAGTAWAARATGLGWTIFNVLHFGYHAAHFSGMAAADVAGNIVTLGLSVILGVALMLPDGGRRGSVGKR